MNKLILVICSLVLIVLYGCIKFEPVSDVPEIAYTNIEIGNYIDDLGNQKLKAILKFDFIDGDANFGVFRIIADDTTLLDSIRYNLFLDPYYKLDGIYYSVEFNPNEPPYYTIFYNPKLDRVGQNKTVKGIITLDIIDLPDYDTIKYDFIIRDRAENNSNVESTADISTN